MKDLKVCPICNGKGCYQCFGSGQFNDYVKFEKLEMRRDWVKNLKGKHEEK